MFIIINLSHLLRWCPELQPSHSWSLCQIFWSTCKVYWHDQLPEAPQEGITNLNDVVSICRWLESYTQYDYPKYKVCRPCYWPRPSQLKQWRLSAHFSSTTGLGVKSTLDKCVRLYIVPSTIRPGSMPHLSRSIHTKCTSTTGWSFNTPRVKTDP